MRITLKLITATAVLGAGLWLIGLTPQAAQAEDAQTLYQKNCNSCHGPSGKGDGPAGKVLKPPPADFAAVLKTMSDADIAKIIKDGGKALGKSPLMAAYGKKLNDEQIDGLVAYIKGLASK